MDRCVVQDDILIANGSVLDGTGSPAKLTGLKADDMQRQQHSTHDRHARFAVITDSAADIPDDDLERLDIHVVPCRVQFGDRGYLDIVIMTTVEFFAELERNPSPPTTSRILTNIVYLL